jgi:hypothetical protein
VAALSTGSATGPDAGLWAPGHYQIRIRAKFEKMILYPPMSILSPFLALAWFGQPWYIQDFYL